MASAMTSEIWKDIVGYEGMYQVSNMGNVKSLERILINKIGVKKKYSGRLLHKNKSTDGYVQAILSKDCICKSINIHTLVAIAFIENPENKKEVNHINGIKIDNHVGNLEWLTHQENMDHAKKNNLIYKTPEATRQEVRTLFAAGMNRAQIEKKLKIAWGTVNTILKNQLQLNS